MNKIIKTNDGSHSLISGKFEESYHSKHGAIQETQTVFIEAALNYKASDQKEITILGIGFGTGLNAFMTYLEAKKQGLNVDYTGVEAYPIDLETASELNYPEELNAKTERETFLSMHRCENNTLQVSSEFKFCKKVCLFEDLKYKEDFDIIYFDAFAPGAQPELWEEEMIKKMYDFLKPGGVLTTYCAKGVVKRCLKSAGFIIEALPGPIGKREMTRAEKSTY
jgi:tRNA U34 5-methylaminomethyl-2-thiouridine-forming methyltransferase MnmC